jgi:hypothetical protein
MCNFKRAGNGIVIGQGHQIHSSISGRLIDLPGFGKTFRTSDLFQDPLGGAFGKSGVDMKIDSGYRDLRIVWFHAFLPLMFGD